MTKINNLLLEIQKFNQKFRMYLREKMPPDYEERIEELRQHSSLYSVVNQMSNHLILAILFVGLGFLFLINSDIQFFLLVILLMIMALSIVQILKIDWQRTQEIKQMYLELGEHLQDQDDELNGIEDNDLLMEYMDKIEDIKNVSRIIRQIEEDGRIQSQLRVKWYQIWLPNLVSYLNEFYGYPENVILSRLEFQQKLFERVLLSGLIGFAFIIVRSFPIHPNPLSFSDILSMIGMFVFLVIFLLLISFPLIRYPALKLELAHWINEHDFSLHINSNHPPRLLNEKELDKNLIENIKIPGDSGED